MHNLLLLIRGEFERMIKYKILQISFVVTVLWLIMLWLIGSDEAVTFVPLFIFMDASMMSVLMIGANLFYEKQENTLKTLLITPSTLSAIIFSKVIGSVYLALQSAIILAVTAMLLFGLEIRLIPLMLFVILIATLHTMIGFVFSMFAKDFNALLGLMIAYMMFFAFPSIFYALGVIRGFLEMVLLISPTHSSLLLIDYTVMKDVALWMRVLGIVYMSIVTVVLTVFVVYPNYMKDAVRD